MISKHSPSPHIKIGRIKLIDSTNLLDERINKQQYEILRSHIICSTFVRNGK